MNKKIHEIETTPVVMVTNSCPVGVFSMNSYFDKDRKYEFCMKCDFFMEDKKCGYNLYETQLIEHRSSTEDDDGSYALPQTNYGWDFKCAKCGHTVHFSSGFSVMQHGDQERCFDCKTVHKYLGKEDDVYKFAIPIVPEVIT